MDWLQEELNDDFWYKGSPITLLVDSNKIKKTDCADTQALLIEDNYITSRYGFQSNRAAMVFAQSTAINLCICPLDTIPKHVLEKTKLFIIFDSTLTSLQFSCSEYDYQTLGLMFERVGFNHVDMDDREWNVVQPAIWIGYGATSSGTAYETLYMDEYEMVKGRFEIIKRGLVR